MAACDERALEVLVPGLVVAALVPAAEVGDVQVVLGGAAHPVHQVVDGVAGPEVAAVAGVADPAGRAPGQAVEPDGGVAGLGLLGQPPFVALVAVDGAPGVLDAGLGAVGGVGVAADLQFQHLQGGAVAGLEQVVQQLAALGFRIVHQQAGVAAAAGDRADPVEGEARLGAVDGDGGGGGGGGGGGRRCGGLGGRRRGQPAQCAGEDERRAQGGAPGRWQVLTAHGGLLGGEGWGTVVLRAARPGGCMPEHRAGE